MRERFRGFTKLRHAELTYGVAETKSKLKATAFACEVGSASNPHKYDGKILRQAQDDRKKGFTLAEVLITLTIIGVVAALTIPNLIASYQKQQYVTELKKVYTEISQALKLMMADEGINKLTASNTLTFYEGSNENEFIERLGNDFFKKYFKIVKDCGTENPSTCFADKYKSIDGGSESSVFCTYSVIIASGASICLKQYSTEDWPGYFLLDINGLSPPNVAGRDLFNFSYYYDGSIDEDVTPECKKGIPNQHNNFLCGGAGSNPQEVRDERFLNYCLESAYGIGCFGKILNDNWKMDY